MFSHVKFIQESEFRIYIWIAPIVFEIFAFNDTLFENFFKKIKQNVPHFL